MIFYASNGGTRTASPRRAVALAPIPMRGNARNFMSTRKTVSKTLRFEIFKRDSFTCQYCGAHPPAIVLEIDHIIPVASGGGNQMDNLISACLNCNRGKSARSLNSIPQSLQAKAKAIKEREAQIKGYSNIMEAKRIRIESEAKLVEEVFSRFHDGYELTEYSLASVRRFIERLGAPVVIDAMETACTASWVRSNNDFKYFCGICWHLIRDGQEI